MALRCFLHSAHLIWWPADVQWRRERSTLLHATHLVQQADHHLDFWAALKLLMTIGRPPHVCTWSYACIFIPLVGINYLRNQGQRQGGATGAYAPL